MKAIARSATVGLVALALVAGLAIAPAAAQPSRERALADLGRADDVGARRAAVQALAEVGEMADLAALAKALRDGNPIVRGSSEEAMWQVWSRSGDDAVDRLFARGVAQMRRRQLDDAVDTFSQVIQRKPGFAEAWNKRATVYFILGDYGKSLSDCDEVIRRNPYHWGALSGYGMIYQQLDQPARALEYYEKALAVNPNLSGVEDRIEELKPLVIQRRKDSI
jgi:tetratricopeptide (TPR) repeat protein